MYAKQIFQIKDIDSADQNRATADIKSQKDKINEDIYLQEAYAHSTKLL